MSEFNAKGCIPLFQGGFADGEREASAALMAAGFPAGSPLVYTAAGWTLAANGDFFGVVSTGSDDIDNQSPMVEGVQQSGSQPVLPVWIGTNMFMLEGSKVAGTHAYPFLQTPAGGTWTVGDSVYVTAAGVYDDTAVGAEPAVGEVLEVVGPAAAATALRVIIRV